MCSICSGDVADADKKAANDCRLIRVLQPRQLSLLLMHHAKQHGGCYTSTSPLAWVNCGSVTGLIATLCFTRE